MNAQKLSTKNYAQKLQKKMTVINGMPSWQSGPKIILLT